jgi:hypothetical protein
MSTPAPTDDALAGAVESSQWPRDPERARLDAPERRRLVEQIVGATRDPREAWERLRPLREAAGCTEDPQRLFHLRPDRFGATPISVRRRMRVCAVPIALCRTMPPRVPLARALPHPVSTTDAVSFSLFAPALARAEQLAFRVGRALGVFGGGTCDSAGNGAAARFIAWATHVPARRTTLERAVVLLAMALLEQGGDGRWTTEPAWLRPSIKLPPRHYETWNDVQVVALGTLAFRTLASRGLLVQPTRSSPGACFHFQKQVPMRRSRSTRQPTLDRPNTSSVLLTASQRRRVLTLTLRRLRQPRRAGGLRAGRVSVGGENEQEPRGLRRPATKLLLSSYIAWV